MNASDTAPFEQLAKMIERELELVAAGRVDEFEAAVAQRGAFLETLPCPPPVEAAAAIERARALHTRVTIEAIRVRESLSEQLATLQRARRVARGYAGPLRPRYTTSA